MPSSPSGKVVLVVDDDVDVRVALATLLGLFGLAVETARDGRSALDYLRDHPPPALIVLDLRMPGMGGLEFLAFRRGEPALRRIPVIVYSGGGPEEEGAAGELLGEEATFLPKDAEPAALVQAVLALCA